MITNTIFNLYVDSPEETPYGQMIFLTMDEADPNIVLREGGLYGIYFNDLTGHYAIIKR